MAAAPQAIGKELSMNWLKRFFRHVMMSQFTLRRMFPAQALQAIEKAVADTEATHRGQVRFAVEAELATWQLWCGLSTRQRAIEIFSQLGVWNTEENNGVLIYVLLADRKVEIVADRGIHRHVGNERWSAICKEIEHHYRKGEFAAGSVIGINKISAELAFYFPAKGLRLNEQQDSPVIL